MPPENLEGPLLLDLPGKPGGEGFTSHAGCDPALREPHPDLRGAPTARDPGSHEALREGPVVHVPLARHALEDRGGYLPGGPATLQALDEFTPAVGTSGEQAQDVGEDLRLPFEGTRVPAGGHGAEGAGADSGGVIVTDPVTGS